jgi:hypothetical protein
MDTELLMEELKQSQANKRFFNLMVITFFTMIGTLIGTLDKMKFIILDINLIQIFLIYIVILLIFLMYMENRYKKYKILIINLILTKKRKSITNHRKKQGYTAEI